MISPLALLLVTACPRTTAQESRAENPLRVQPPVTLLAGCSRACFPPRVHRSGHLCERCQAARQHVRALCRGVKEQQTNILARYIQPTTLGGRRHPVGRFLAVGHCTTKNFSCKVLAQGNCVSVGATLMVLTRPSLKGGLRYLQANRPTFSRTSCVGIRLEALICVHSKERKLPAPPA